MFAAEYLCDYFFAVLQNLFRVYHLATTNILIVVVMLSASLSQKVRSKTGENIVVRSQRLRTARVYHVAINHQKLRIARSDEDVRPV